eukprot:gene13188-biopygen10516
MFEPGVACKDPLKNEDVLDYRNWKIPPKRALTEAEDADVKKAFELLTRKGVYPYDWVDSIEKMQETSLPPKEAFYNKLYDSSISDEDYTYAQQVWQFFNCQTFQDYHELYLKTGVLLLADIFESFRKQSLKFYKLDPAHYLTAPSLAWDAMLKMTGVTLELLSEEKKDIHLMIEDGIRGGVSIAVKRHAESTENNTLMYLDANNLYGWAMSQPMPYGDGIVLRRWVRNPKFYGVIEINEDTLLVEKKIGKVKLNKPMYVGFSILDISKTLMYDFHYNFAKPNLPNVPLCYMDTDSFIYDIPMSQDQVNRVLKDHEDGFDFSNYDKEHPNYSVKNKKVIGK